MKRFILLLLTIAAISYSCDKLADFVITHTFEDSYTVDLPASGPTTFSDEFSFDATDNQEVADNLNSISGYTVSSLKFSISEFTPDTGIVSGTFTFSFKDSNGNPLGNTSTEVSIDNLFMFNVLEHIENKEAAIIFIK